MAWLNATPEEGTQSRRAEFERDDLAVDMPECSASYILEYLFELGITIGEHALTHGEIRAWMDNTGIDLSSWEAQTLKKLSEAYLSMSYESRKPDAETPWTEAPYYMTAKWRKAMRIKQSLRNAAEV